MTGVMSLETAVSLIASWVKEQNEPEPGRLDVWLETADLLPAVRALHEARWGYLAAVTGLDVSGAEDGAERFEVLYHFCEGAQILGLRVRLAAETAVVPSVCGVIPSAGFFERELSEMFGITVEGTPDPSRLFLPDEWPEGVYPLRKAYRPGEGGGDNG